LFAQILSDKVAKPMGEVARVAMLETAPKAMDKAIQQAQEAARRIA
jgi:hypothetical protein